MRSKLLINCDMGEWDAPHLKNVDAQLMAHIQLCNVACGGHAGSKDIIETTIRLAKNCNVFIGAHPGYNDRKNFGRVYQKLSKKELKKTLIEQIERVMDACIKRGHTMYHVKPHGALYHACHENKLERDCIIEVMTQICPQQYLLVLPDSRLEKEAKKAGIKVLREAFLDRLYIKKNTLASRSHTNAVLNIEEAKEQFEQITNGKINTVNEIINQEVNTICIHGDNPHALSILKTINPK